MALSESEHQAFRELWAGLPDVAVRRRTLARYAVTRRARRVGAWVRRQAVVLALLAYGTGMVVFAGLLFHNGYAAGAAGTIALGVGVLVGRLTVRR